MTLTEFLLARIAEEQEMAEVVRLDSVGWTIEGDMPLGWQPLMTGTRRGSPVMWTNCDYVLAECEAKRRLIALADEVNGLDSTVEQDRGAGSRDYDTDPEAGDVMLRILALPYADHPDYHSEWSVA